MDSFVLQSALALEGGRPTRTAPPPSWPVFEPDEIDAVVETLRSGKVNYWTGNRVRAFETSFAEVHACPFALALANGTVALEVILRAHGIGPGDEVIVTPRSFIASASCVDLVGARPVFADIDVESELITPATVGPLIGKNTKAIIVVHLNGRPADMPGFMHIAKQDSLLVFEDCAQALGAQINGKMVGSFGHASAFSFCQDKIITTGGEGGMALFKDDSSFKRAWSYRDNGKDYELTLAKAPAAGFRWLHTGFGSNWRMTEIQAAIGLRQMTKLGAWVAARNENAAKISNWLSKYPSVHVPRMQEKRLHAFYRLSFRINENRLKPGWTRNRVMDALIAEGIPCLSGVCPEIYREEAYARHRRDMQQLPTAAYLGTVSLALLVHPALDDDFLNDCRVAIDKVFSAITI